MNLNYTFSFLFILALAPTIFTGCIAGMLLFYRDSKTIIVYKSVASKNDYFIVHATTLSHCGCTHLLIDYYKNGSKEFDLFYTDNIARKTIYKFDSKLNQRDTVRLIAITGNDYTTPFDSLDMVIFNRIDSIAIQKPKGLVYQIKKTQYLGFISDPYYNHYIYKKQK